MRLAVLVRSAILFVAVVAGHSGPTYGFQRKFGPGVCGPADPVYIRGATETGGQPFFLSPTEVAKSALIMSATSQSELMLWASGQGEQTYTIPVDPSVRRATFSASFDSTGGTLTVVSPGGADVQQDARTEDAVLNCGRIVTINMPDTGSWQLRVRPSGRFWLLAHARTELALISTEFVQVAGRPGHEGFFKIPGQPIAGRPATLMVRLSDPTKNTAFQLVSVAGAVLQTLDLKSVDGEEFVGEVSLPDVPFRVVATGFDESGAPFQRVHSALFRAARVEVVPPYLDAVAAGATTPVTFKIRNFGPVVRLVLTATSGGKVVAVEPPILELDAGAAATATVSLEVPADARPGSDVSVFLVASRDQNSPSMNYARTEISVASK